MADLLPEIVDLLRTMPARVADEMRGRASGAAAPWGGGAPGGGSGGGTATADVPGAETPDDRLAALSAAGHAAGGLFGRAASRVDQALRLYAALQRLTEAFAKIPVAEVAEAEAVMEAAEAPEAAAEAPEAAPPAETPETPPAAEPETAPTIEPTAPPLSEEERKELQKFAGAKGAAWFEKLLNEQAAAKPESAAPAPASETAEPEAEPPPEAAAPPPEPTPPPQARPSFSDADFDRMKELERGEAWNETLPDELAGELSGLRGKFQAAYGPKAAAESEAEAELPPPATLPVDDRPFGVPGSVPLDVAEAEGQPFRRPTAPEEAGAWEAAAGAGAESEAAVAAEGAEGDSLAGLDEAGASLADAAEALRDVARELRETMKERGQGGGEGAEGAGAYPATTPAAGRPAAAFAELPPVKATPPENGTGDADALMQTVKILELLA